MKAKTSSGLGEFRAQRAAGREQQQSALLPAPATAAIAASTPSLPVSALPSINFGKVKSSLAEQNPSTSGFSSAPPTSLKFKFSLPEKVAAAGSVECGGSSSNLNGSLVFNFSKPDKVGDVSGSGGVASPER